MAASAWLDGKYTRLIVRSLTRMERHYQSRDRQKPPSLIIPFSGVLMGGYRAALWGLILALLAVFVQGRALLWPRLEGTVSHWQGLKLGLLKTGQLYVLVTLSLFVAANYEGMERFIQRSMKSIPPGQ